MHLSGVDHALLWWILDHRLPWLDQTMLALTAVGEGGLVWMAIGLGLFIARRLRWQEFATLVFALVVTTLVADFLIKPFVQRLRPFRVSMAIHVLGHQPHGFSFPSGHAADAFAAALVLWKTAPAARLAWIVVAFGIAYSRLYLGVHYPSDIVGSILVGLVCAALVLFATRRYEAGSIRRSERSDHDERGRAPGRLEDQDGKR